MSADSPRGPAPDIPASDEDWKEAVQAENRALDESLKRGGREPLAAAPDAAAAAQAASAAADANSESRPEAAAAGGREARLPEADFDALVAMFSTPALMALGMLPHPASGKPEPHRELARHYIDLLGVLEEKTRRNLDPDESRLLEATLHDLRMAFVRQG